MFHTVEQAVRWLNQVKQPVLVYHLMDESIELEMATQTEQTLARAREQNVRRTIVSVIFDFSGFTSTHFQTFGTFALILIVSCIIAVLIIVVITLISTSDAEEISTS